jgi:pimeloyl-ACP methyl ester carboxylesterase
MPETIPGIQVSTITTPRISTRLLTCGPEGGDPVIFVHGNVSTATFWEETMLSLPDHYRAIAYDQRGYGGADPAEKIDAALGLADLAGDLDALITTLGYDKAHVVGHSAGGSVLWRFIMDFPDRCRSVTLVNPGSPYGFGGTIDLNGRPIASDFAGSGGGIVNPNFPPLLTAREKGDGQGTPRWTMNSFYFKPPFRSPREAALIDSMCDTHVGPQDYPGDFVPSQNWPMAAPGKFGMVNALSPKYQKAPSTLYAIDPKPPILWIRGSHDQIVSDTSFFDVAYLGQLGLIPGYPGAEVAPPQPMVSQTRAVLDSYAAQGGQYTEVVIADTGHTPYLEDPEAFDTAFHEFLDAH